MFKVSQTFKVFKTLKVLLEELCTLEFLRPWHSFPPSASLRRTMHQSEKLCASGLRQTLRSVSGRAGFYRSAVYKTYIPVVPGLLQCPVNGYICYLEKQANKGFRPYCPC
jgi:hypothetical protein